MRTPGGTGNTIYSQQRDHNNYEKGTIKIARLTKFPNRKGPESNLRK